MPSAKSGLYALKDSCADNSPFNSGIIAVYCDMETDGGGWIVIQRRNASQGKVDFFRNWRDYENGFGDFDGEFWIGLKAIHYLTYGKSMSLQVSVWNEETDESITWTTPSFVVNGAEDNYRVNFATGHSDETIYSPFTSGRAFSTYDYDNSGYITNCAFDLQAGWWYSGSTCSDANPNGRHQIADHLGTSYTQQRLNYRTGSSYTRSYTVFTHSEMKIRSSACSPQ